MQPERSHHLDMLQKLVQYHPAPNDSRVPPSVSICQFKCNGPPGHKYTAQNRPVPDEPPVAARSLALGFWYCMLLVRMGSMHVNGKIWMSKQLQFHIKNFRNHTQFMHVAFKIRKIKARVCRAKLFVCLWFWHGNCAENKPYTKQLHPQVSCMLPASGPFKTIAWSNRERNRRVHDTLRRTMITITMNISCDGCWCWAGLNMRCAILRWVFPATACFTDNHICPSPNISLDQASATSPGAATVLALQVSQRCQGAWPRPLAGPRLWTWEPSGVGRH